ncbi:MAG: class I SAM-dependent methyltransferase, partial [Bryobacteraceae bacterium]
WGPLLFAEARSEPALHKMKKFETNAYDVSWALDRDGTFHWGGLDLSKRLSYLYHYFQVSPGSFRGKRVLDAGCGNGALSAALARDGAEVVAFDYSNIVERAEANKAGIAGNGTVHYVQADAAFPPFAEHSFDAIYSDGVLHLTGDTYSAFKKLARLVKPAGRLFVSVTRKDLGRGYRLRKIPVDALQWLFRHMPVRLSSPLCLLGAAFLSVYVRVQQWLRLKEKRKIGPLRHEALILWHTVAMPKHQYHVPEEVEAWFRDLGFRNVQETTIPALGHTGFGLVGVRAAGNVTVNHSQRAASGVGA